MKKKIAINGLGRIGRITLNYLLTKKNIKVVAVNDITSPETLAHLLKYDSNYGINPHQITYDQKHLIIDQKTYIKSYQIKQPDQLPWKELEVDIVLESTGRFTDYESIMQHKLAGAKKVLLSAPGKENIPSLVLGVNDDILKDSSLDIVSNTSCTTNCLAPIIKLLDDELGIVGGLMTTVHAYTSDQNLQDAPHKDLRRARSALRSMIPTSTGAAKSIGFVLPHLQGKLDGLAIRVPIPVTSVVDLVIKTKKVTSKEKVNQLFQEVAEKRMKNILAYNTQPIVSVDIIGNTHSCIVDGSFTYVMDDQIKVIAWYDNESGYASRLAEVIEKW